MSDRSLKLKNGTTITFVGPDDEPYIGKDFNFLFYPDDNGEIIESIGPEEVNRQ